MISTILAHGINHWLVRHDPNAVLSQVERFPTNWTAAISASPRLAGKGGTVTIYLLTVGGRAATSQSNKSTNIADKRLSVEC